MEGMANCSREYRDFWEMHSSNGSVTSTENASAPVGTTVKITKFFQTLPVRKSAALKEPTKTIAKIKRLLQSYAFARPSVRFSLRVLKGKANKDDFMYAPKKDGNVEDAVLKVIGKECALQCDWTAIESDGFEIHAFLPKPDALGSKIAKLGVFLSVDRRPVSTGRGTPKKIATFFKERLRKANISCSSVKDPFLCMNVICPPGSYDPNIEPAKDDVLFEREDVVMGAVTKLFMAYYPEAVAVSDVGDDSELSTLEQPSDHTSAATPTTRPDTAFSIFEETLTIRSKRPETAFSILEEAALPEEARHPVKPISPPRWRSNMYGIDEDDLELLDYENQPPVIEEEEDGRRAASVSNPWTIARMNASLKPKQTTRNSQLMTPAKGQGDVAVGSSSPVLAPHTRQRLPLEPLTPETASRVNAPRPLRDPTSQQRVERVSQVSGRPHLVSRSTALFHTIYTHGCVC
jgi:DNA mismatch repair ATPase MutL